MKIGIQLPLLFWTLSNKLKQSKHMLVRDKQNYMIIKFHNVQHYYTCITITYAYDQNNPSSLQKREALTVGGCGGYHLICGREGRPHRKLISVSCEDEKPPLGGGAHSELLLLGDINQYLAPSFYSQKNLLDYDRILV